MTKRRRIPTKITQLGEEEDVEEEQEEGDEGADARVAPNTTFLGRLVTGLASVNQRQIETTTSNAANLSIGATGAASLRLQLQRTANARTARLATLRRVVLSSAAQQRLTLCSALLAEVAQGFGFRLTVRQPDGRDVGARQAITAAAELQARQARATAAAVAAVPDDKGVEEGVAAAGAAPQDGGGATNGSAGGGATAPPDPLDPLDPLDVDLDLDVESTGMLTHLLHQPPARPTAAATLAGSGVVRRLAKSPSGTRPGGMNGLLSGRLTSAAFGSIGLIGPKKMAAQQALQAAKRRVLMRAASNAAADEAGATADAVAAVLAAAPEEAGADTSAGGAADAMGAAAGTGGRRIVWNPVPMGQPVAGTDPSTATASAAVGDEGAVAAPLAKRARTSAAATPVGDTGGDEGIEAADAGAAEGEAAGEVSGRGDGGRGTPTVDAMEEGGNLLTGEGEEDGGRGDNQEPMNEAGGGGASGGRGCARQSVLRSGRLGDTSGSPALAGRNSAPAQTSRLLGAALAGSVAAAGGAGGRLRVPIQIGGGADKAAAPGDEDKCGGAAAVAGESGSAPAVAPRSRPASSAAGGRPAAAGAGPLGSPAGKLFGAAMRHLQRGGGTGGQG